MNNYAHIIAPLFLCVLLYFNPRSPMVQATMGATFIPISKLGDYAFQLYPHCWHTHMLMCLVSSFCRFGANILTISAGRVKKSHFAGTHHQPMHIHQSTPRCLFFSCVSETICTFTLLLPHFGHVIQITSFLSISTGSCPDGYTLLPTVQLQLQNCAGECDSFAQNPDGIHLFSP